MKRHDHEERDGLFKRHVKACTNQGATGKALARCACRWKFKRTYKGKPVDKFLDDWTGKPIDPKRYDLAVAAMKRIDAAIANKNFDPAREHPAVGSAVDTFAGLLTLWVEKYGLKQHRTVTEPDGTKRLNDQVSALVEALKESSLGAMPLDEFALASDEIETFLDEQAVARGWSSTNATRDKWYWFIYGVCERAMGWKSSDGRTALMTQNPMRLVERITVITRTDFHNRMIDEATEARLFECCELLNAPQHLPNKRARIDQATADKIRAAVASGEPQRTVAARFDISRSVVCQIVAGQIWNPAKYVPQTKGDEMSRRLLGALYGGLRAGEMMLIQLKHIPAKPFIVVDEEGKRHELYRIVLPAEMTKGGRKTGKPETIYVGYPEFKMMIDRRRLQLKNNPEAFVFGTERGEYQKGFKRMWHKLFALAGLTVGRKEDGVVWHSTKHEFASRVGDRTSSSNVGKDVTRHQQVQTMELYMHSREVAKARLVLKLNLPA